MALSGRNYDGSLRPYDHLSGDGFGRRGNDGLRALARTRLASATVPRAGLRALHPAWTGSEMMADENTRRPRARQTAIALLVGAVVIAIAGGYLFQTMHIDAPIVT